MSIQSDIAELRMIALNISAKQQEITSTMTAQLDAVVEWVKTLGGKIDGLLAKSANDAASVASLTTLNAQLVRQLRAVSDERDALKAQAVAGSSADAPADIQAQADAIKALADKIQ